jgi:uncharacterized protein (TIGR00251 family)
VPGAPRDEYAQAVEAHGDDLVVHLHVQTRGGRDAVVGRHGGALKVRVAAPPVDGRANEAVRALLARSFGVAPGRVDLVSGATSRTKRYRIRGLGREVALERLRSLLGCGG